MDSTVDRTGALKRLLESHCVSSQQRLADALLGATCPSGQKVVDLIDEEALAFLALRKTNEVAINFSYTRRGASSIDIFIDSVMFRGMKASPASRQDYFQSISRTAFCVRLAYVTVDFQT